MEEDITCKFRATTTVLKGVFIFLNSIFVCGYWLFFSPIPKSSRWMSWEPHLQSAHVSTALPRFPWENGKHLALISLLQLLSPLQRSGQELGQRWCLTLFHRGIEAETSLRCYNTELASVSYNYTYNLIFSICYSLIFFSNNQCHLVIKIFNWIQPKILFLFVSLFTNGLHSWLSVFP